MTRLFTDGGEMGDMAFWDFYNVGFVECVAAPSPIGGLYCYAGAYLGAYRVTSSVTEFYLRYRARSTDPTQAQNGSLLAWRHDSTTLGKVTLDSINRISACVGTSTIVATSSVVMSQNVWYLIEVHVLIDGANGVIEIYIDGVPAASFTGDTQPGLDTDINNIYWNTNAYTTTYMDDLAMNDTLGGSDDSWCGDGIITKMIPDGDGAHNNWTNSDGDSVSNFSFVDEYPNDGDLTYVYCDGSSTGTQDQYTLSDLDYTNKTVLRIYPEARARKTAADGSTIKLGILPNGGVDDLSAARNLLVDTYIRVVGDEYTTNPLDSSTWDETSLDSLQVIAEIG